jgi:hypothetical protein
MVETPVAWLRHAPMFAGFAGKAGAPRPGEPITLCGFREFFDDCRMHDVVSLWQNDQDASVPRPALFRNTASRRLRVRPAEPGYEPRKRSTASTRR